MTGEPTLGRAAARARGVLLLPRAQPLEPGIVHLGLSNFHRAHQAVYTARALDVEDGPWGVVGVARSSRDVLEALQRQERAYAVLTLDAERTEAEVVAVHTDLLLATADAEAVVARLADPATRIITITVTEAGYTFDPATRTLDLSRDGLVADLAGRPPLTTVGQLAAGLRRRHDASGQPLTVLSCDNLVGNGDLLRGLVREFWERSVPEPELGELLAWSEAQVGYPSSMVDRIVPRTTDQHRRLVRQQTGLVDACPVPAEPFSMWAVEDAFATERPAWDRVGVILTDDVHRYEVLKIRLLNGTHSLLAYLGMLTGARTIDEAVGDPDVRLAAEAYLDEVSTTVEVPAEVSLADYRSSLMQRFANSAVGHRTSQVGTDGSLKLPARVPDPVAIRAASGRRSPMGALLVAAFVRVTCDPDAVDPGVGDGLRDPALPTLRSLGARFPRESDRVRAVLTDTGIFPPSLGTEPGFAEDCAALARTLRQGGVRAAIGAALQLAGAGHPSATSAHA